MTGSERPFPTLLQFSEHGDRSLTHRMFRYPAKFHVPVAAGLVEQFSAPGQSIFDPFCGSGTILVEAAARGRHSIGSDLDPLAVAVAKAKTADVDEAVIRRHAETLTELLRPLARSTEEYMRLATSDISAAEMADELEDLWVPAIPLLTHWFRNYVVVDLARIRAAIAGLDLEEVTRNWFDVVFASVIRNASNADPVPVSGLEVTAHMRRLDEAGRVVNPFQLFERALRKAQRGLTAFQAERDDAARVCVFQADATTVSLSEQPDVIITSPPYQNAVDYYRRHQLEMFWLGLTATQADRIALKPAYIGTPRIPASNPVFDREWTASGAVQHWIERMTEISTQRAQDFRGYMMSMETVFDRWAQLLPTGGRAVCVVGRSTWNGADIPTEQLFVEVAHGKFSLDQHLTYPVRNRYMSYTRHNGASIDEEHVLVLRSK